MKYIRLVAPETADSSNAVSPQIMSVSPHGTALISTLTGPVFTLSNGQQQDISWSQRISSSQGPSIDAA
jgi:hypothetical protein